MISKELLSEVLKINVISVEIEDNGIHICAYRNGVHTEFTCNIYELAHECKEWALSKGYIVDERGVNVFLLTSDGIDVVWKSYGKPFCPYRVFEPCEWIMEQTK